MKRRTFIQSFAAGAVTLVGFKPRINLGAETAGTLETAFRQPPPGAYAKTWWHWMNGNITAEGITLDIEAMKRAGIRGFQIFQVGTGIPKGPVDYSSAEHTRLLQHAAKEADRLDMEFDIMNCPGWSSSGGPWITPEFSMKQFTWSETLVRGGGQRVVATLKQPLTKLGYYRDAFVLAFPALEGESRPWYETLRRASTNTGAVDRGVLIYADPRIGVELLPPTQEQPAFLQLEFSEPFEARSLAAYCVPLPDASRPSPEHAGTPIWLEVSDDGVQFRNVCDVDWGDSGEESVEFPATASFPAVRAKFYRILTWHARRITDFRMSGAARIPHWARKANFTRSTGFGAETVEVPQGSIIDPSKVIDITQYMDTDSRLSWDAPEGTWTVLRIGQTTTGVQNHPAPDGGWGLECDKYSREAYDFHFDHFFGDLLEALGPLAARGLAGGVIDSYETGMQNWTREFPPEFSKRRGYDLRKYLPAMTGRVVESSEVSERFLWDIRRTCADLMADHYYGRFAERCRQHKVKAYAEPYSGGPFEELQCGARLDVPMGEFWVGQGNNNYSVKLAGSIGHVFGQPVVGCESFTGDQTFAKWQNYPYQMKGQGDLMYTQGLNQYIFHRNAMQPHPTALPGMTMGPWGWECDRTNTIHDGLSGWLEYAARSQNMLRQGTLVADLIYYVGVDVPVDTPVYPEQLKPTPPEGYYYDVANEEAILTRMKGRDGSIVLPDGLSYRVLVLPDDKRLNLDVLRKVRDMVKEGVALVGPKPEVNPGLTEYPNSDSELRQIADEVWGDLNGSTVTERSYGKGRVFWGLPMATVLDKLNIKPDCDITSRSGDAAINFIHRRAGNAEVYFVANRRRRAEDMVCTFRVKDKQPELWNPETGEITPLNLYDKVDAGVRVPLQLNPAEAVFVVFRSPATARHLRSIAKDSKTIAGTDPFPAFQAGRQRNVTNDFTLSVWIKPDLDLYLPRKGDSSHDVPVRSLVISPPEGDTVYGSGHVSCGLMAGRNGVAVLERARSNWHTLISTPMPISGWAHVAVVYSAGAPLLYVNGELAGQAEASGAVVHPGVSDARERDGAEYFDGDMSDPELIKEALTENRIQELAAAAIPSPIEPPEVEWAGGTASDLLVWQDGSYTLQGAAGNSILKVSGIGKPVQISGPWQVSFPPNFGAPPEVTLPQLISLHQHSDPGVKYFSGTATYSKQISISPGAASGDRRLYLDLGWVHVVAQVRVNGKDLGLLWKPPFRLDITSAVRHGENKLEVLVTNQWVNRLIGDELLPPENEYGPGGAIKVIPEWYLHGKPKPSGGRSTFATWKHFSKDSPLLVSGLVGPVRLRTAVRRRISS
ncbi:MAG: glycosyl hydrolase [Terriglobia bacterium]